MVNPGWKAFPPPTVCIALMLAVMLGGCSKEDLNKLTEQVKTATTDTVEQVQKQVAPVLPKTGQFQVTADGPVNSPTGHAALIVLGEGRPAVLQLRSYANVNDETFPAIFFQGTTGVGTVADLVGKTVTGKVFLQNAVGGPVWASEDGAPVTVSVQAVEGSELVGIFSNGMVQDATGRSLTLTGSFRAVIAPDEAPVQAIAVETTGGAQ
jgi:hypothetical protein